MADNETKFMEGTKASGNGFPENYVNNLFVDTKPQVNSNGDVDLTSVDEGNWARLAGGITTITPRANETSTTDYYYDGGGFGDTDVTGKQVQLAVSGNRKIGDPGQDYVADMFWKFGNAVRTRLIWIENGKPVIAQATLTNIVPTGGAANAKQTLSFTVSFNGRPRVFNGQLTMAATAQGGIYKASVDTTKTAGTDQAFIPAVIQETAGDSTTQPTQPNAGSGK